MEAGAQVYCSICGSHQHVRSACTLLTSQPPRREDIRHLFQKVEESNDEEDKEFVPLRKKLKRKSTGKEDNFMLSYYNEEKAISELSEQEIARIRAHWGIEIEGDDPPRPIRRFSEGGFSQDLLFRLESNGCIEPTPIQMQALPCVMSGRDVIGLAETGSGKTLAYVLPLLMFLKTKAPVQPGQGPYALILAPTRELAEQIQTEIRKYAGLNTSNLDSTSQYYNHSQPYPSSIPIRTHLVTGGVPIPAQVEALTSGCEVVIATPGRLLDLISRGAMRTESLSYLVFDEADRMLALEMELQLREIVDRATICARQTLLFSATMNEAVMRLIRSAVLNPLTIMVGGNLESGPKAILQEVIFMHSHQKKTKLLATLRNIERPPVLIFCNNHYTVDKVVALLKTEQFHVAGLHGEKIQNHRFQVMRAFKEGGLDVLVSTDLAARGIDVKDVSVVILYDMPETLESYIHRIGRTGRAGQSGRAVSFLTLECKIAAELKKFLKSCKQQIPQELQNTKQFGHAVTKTEFGDVVHRH